MGWREEAEIVAERAPDWRAEIEDQAEGPVAPSLATFSYGKSKPAAEGAEKERVLAGALNVPASMLTGDPETDRRIAENVWERGGTRALTRADALKAGAVAAGLGLAPVTGVPAAMASGGLLSAGLSSQEAPAGVAQDAILGAGTGGAIAKVLPMAFRAAAKLAPRLKTTALEYGRKAITGVSSPLARRKELPESAVRAAFKVDAIRPGSTVGGTANRLQEAADPVAKQYAEILKRLEAAGVTGPNAAKLAADLMEEAAQRSGQTIEAIDPGPAVLRSTANELLGLKQGMHGVKRVPGKPLTGEAPGGDLPLMSAEGMKRALQQNAASEYVKEGPTSLAGEAKKRLAARFREAIETSVAEQAAKAPAEAAAFEPVKSELHNLLTALGPAREAAARATRRTPFGLHEALGLASGISSGSPSAAVAAPAAMSALRGRSASTVAWTAEELANALETLATSRGGVVDPQVRALIVSLRRPMLGPVPAAAEDEPRNGNGGR